MASPRVGSRIGKYVVERIIGSGGMGIVVAAKHEQLGERVAIKVLTPKAAEDRVQVERFVREARATVRIKSENVVRVLDAGADEATGAPYLVMEHLEGRDIGRMVRKDGPMAPTVAVDLMMQVCEAVASAHAVGIIHRDLKPSNFFVTAKADGAPLVKVLDFGISKAVDRDGAAADPKLTETHAVFGSPTYMSPEQIRSARSVDARSDVWSLGVALFEMLTGKLPFMADNVAGLLASIIADNPYSVRVFAPAVPEELESVVLCCLHKDPAARIGSVGELASRLAPFASFEASLAAGRIERLERTTGPRLPPPASRAPHPPARVPGPPAPAALSTTAPFPPTPLGAPLGVASTDTDLSAAAMAPRAPGRAKVAGVLAGVALACLLVVATTVYAVGQGVGGGTPGPAASAPPTEIDAAVAARAAAPSAPATAPPRELPAKVVAASPEPDASAREVPSAPAEPTAHHAVRKALRPHATAHTRSVKTAPAPPKTDALDSRY